MLNQMTEDEKTRIKKGNFDELWNHVWSDEEELSPLYKEIKDEHKVAVGVRFEL